MYSAPVSWTAVSALLGDLQGSPRPTNPGPMSRGHACHERVVEYVLRDDRSRGDHRPATDGDTGQENAARPDRATGAEDDARRPPVRRGLGGAVDVDGPRIEIVGEHDRRPDEDAVTDPRRPIEQSVVLHLHPVAEHDSSSTKTPRPIVHPAPTTAPARRCANPQTVVSAPTRAPSSTSADWCTRALAATPVCSPPPADRLGIGIVDHWNADLVHESSRSVGTWSTTRVGLVPVCVTAQSS